MKAGNTLDTIVPGPGGRQVVRHYLQDVGSTFGAGANGPREFDEGWESLFDAPRVVLRLLSFGLYLRPWQHVDYPEVPPSIGRFEGVPSTLATGRRGCVPAAIRHARADDEFWAARRVMAFTDEMIAAAVRTGAYSDPRAESYLTEVLDRPARRDRAGLPAGDHAAGRFCLRSRHGRVVRQRRRARQGRRGADRRLSRAMAAGGQRHRDRHADWRRSARRRAARAGAGAAARGRERRARRRRCGPSTRVRRPGPRRSRCRSCARRPAGGWSAWSGRSRAVAH